MKELDIPAENEANKKENLIMVDRDKRRYDNERTKRIREGLKMIIKSSTSASLNSQAERGFPQSEKLSQQRLTQKQLTQEAVGQGSKETVGSGNIQDSGTVGLQKRLAISEDNDHYRLQISREGMQLYRAAKLQQESLTEEPAMAAEQKAQIVAAASGLSPKETIRMGVLNL